MCGITGYIDFNARTPSETLSNMVKALNHRGPDDAGYELYNCENVNIGLGQTRLSILDLSPAAHQPMQYGGLSIVYNGEIYNFMELRKELEDFGHKFISNSDTEVILHSYKKWGITFVNKLIGMYVIVIYNKEENKLLIFRDRAGVKPIYYYWNDGLFLFASELKALFVHSKFQKKIDKNSLALYFDFGYIPSPYSIFYNTFKIEPGKYLILDIKKKEISLNSYWNIDNFYIENKFDINYDDAKREVKYLLLTSCNYRMIADVPVGIFLSGGYDSSLVTAILQTERTEKMKTFTIGFEDKDNEAPYARKVAEFLGTDHSEHTCSSSEAQSIIPELPFYYDEPFGDSSAIPTILVSRLARNKVKVALSADGGDELFAGYKSYGKFQNVTRILDMFPKKYNYLTKPILSSISHLTPAINIELKHKLSCIAKALDKDRQKQFVDIVRMASSLPEFYTKRLYNYVPYEYENKYNKDFRNFNSLLDIKLAIDYEMYLQNDILTKVDRASMSTSLEGREPLVDHRLAEFVARLPLNYKINKQGGKRILKDIVHDYIPKELVDRPKTGFSLPIYKWLTNDLHYLVDEYLNMKSISESDLFNSDFVHKQVTLFNKDKLYYKPLIWKLLIFQMWYCKWIK